MKISIECTVAEQTQIKQNLKINETDTGIIYTQQILDKPEDMTSGQYALSMVDWNIKETDK